MDKILTFLVGIYYNDLTLSCNFPSYPFLAFYYSMSNNRVQKANHVKNIFYIYIFGSSIEHKQVYKAYIKSCKAQS